VRDADTPADNERRQTLWRWLLLAALLLLVAETVFSNRMQKERAGTPVTALRKHGAPVSSRPQDRRTQGVA
jgi:anti-sigma-K factor RskA